MVSRGVLEQPRRRSGNLLWSTGAARQPLVYPNFCVSKKLFLFVLVCLPVCLPLTFCLTVSVLMLHCNAQLCDSRKVMALHCTSLIHGSTD